MAGSSGDHVESKDEEDESRLSDMTIDDICDDVMLMIHEHSTNNRSRERKKVRMEKAVTSRVKKK